MGEKRTMGGKSQGKSRIIVYYIFRVEQIDKKEIKIRKKGER